MNLDFLFNWMDRYNIWIFNRKCLFYKKKLKELKNETKRHTAIPG